MKRLFGYCGLRASAWAASPKLHLALMLSCLLSPVAFGQEGGLSGPGGAPKSSHGAISDAVKAAAFRERCVLLSTKFKHQGVDFQSKSGIGCIISTPQGQRILAMPFSMTMPVEVVQGNEKRSVACSMLLASKLGNTDTFQESLASFTERVDEFPMESLPKPAKKEPLLESERRIYQALDERGEVNFNGTPLSAVMKYFRERYSVPIVIVDKSLEFESVAPDEPVTIELPEVSFRSALNLILKPYNLTFVVENEVLRITSYEEAGKGDDPIRHWDPKGPVLETERKIFRALSERGEVNFIGTPLSDVMKIFRNAYWIPIVLDEKNLEMENITSDEPITLELPVLSFRSALNLILEPLGLTYVIENEVLLITSKAIALAEHPAPFSSANPKGVIAIGTRFVGGLGGMGGGGMGGQPGLY